VSTRLAILLYNLTTPVHLRLRELAAQLAARLYGQEVQRGGNDNKVGPTRSGPRATLGHPM
jgi:hypothetical protein